VAIAKMFSFFSEINPCHFIFHFFLHHFVISFAAIFWKFTPEPHSFDEISQSQLLFDFQEGFRAKFTFEMSQMTMVTLALKHRKISEFCLESPKNTSKA